MTAPAAEAAPAVEASALATDLDAIARRLADRGDASAPALDRVAIERVLATFDRWDARNLLHELVAALRAAPVTGPPPTGAPRSVWTRLVARLPAGDRIRLYDLLADGNVDARRADRFTEDLIEFWDVHMAEHARAFEHAYDALAADTSDGDRARRAADALLAELDRYDALDRRYGMGGTLLSKFLLKVDRVVTVAAGGVAGARQVRRLDDIPRHLEPIPRRRYLRLLEASTLELVRAPPVAAARAPVELAAIVEAFGTVADVVAYLERVGDAPADDVIRCLARSPSKRPLLVGLVTDHAATHPSLCARARAQLPASP